MALPPSAERKMKGKGNSWCKSCEFYNTPYFICFWECSMCKTIHSKKGGKLIHIGSKWKKTKEKE